MKKQEFERMINLGKDHYKVIFINGDSNAYWSIVAAGDKFYYIEYDPKHFINDMDDITITLYNKVNANAKHQADYPKNMKDINDIIKYIDETKNKNIENLPGTYDQIIFYELKTVINGKTLEKHLKDIAGYRENDILNHLKYIVKENNTDKENYNILKFEDEDGNFFKINTKNVERLIIG